MKILTAFIPLVPLIYSLYGLYSKSRLFFLLGYAIFGFFIMIAEFNFFLINGNSTHLLILALFCIQFIISYPSRLKFDGSKLFRVHSVKNLLLLVLINIIGVIVVLNNQEISILGALHHILFVVIAFLFYYLTLSNKIPLYEAPTD